MFKVIGADGREYGPISAAQVRQWIQERRLNNQSLIQPEGETGWKPLSFYPEFAADVAQAALPPPGTVGAGPTNNMAIASLVLGIASWVCCCNLGIFNVLGLVFGFIALSQIKRKPDESGKALAIVGIVLSGAGLVMSIIGVSFGLVGHLIDAVQNW
jgi:hypothetical protein